MPIPKWLQRLSNATIKASIAGDPAVTTASGYIIDSKTGNVSQSAIDNPDTKRLRDNLGVLGTTATGITLAGAPQIITHGLNVMTNPTIAKTNTGAFVATAADAAGLVGGLKSLSDYWANWKNTTWKDTPGILLSAMSLIPGSSQLTNPSNLNRAITSFKQLNPAYRYKELLERIKTNPELTPYYNDAASAKLKVVLKKDGTYDPDTHSVELPLFSNDRTIAHEMGHAALRGGEMEIPGYDYTGAGENLSNEAAADWFANNINARYLGKDKILQARQNAIDNFDIIRHSIKDGTLHFGEPINYIGYHQSSTPIREFKFPFNERWDVVTHGADPNGVFFTLNGPAKSGFLSERPYISRWHIQSRRPLIQEGELRGPKESKNNLRNAIVDYARQNGADAVEFRRIADNNLQNQNILFATDKSGISFKYESPTVQTQSINYTDPITYKLKGTALTRAAYKHPHTVEQHFNSAIPDENVIEKYGENVLKQAIRGAKNKIKLAETPRSKHYAQLQLNNLETRLAEFQQFEQEKIAFHKWLDDVDNGRIDPWEIQAPKYNPTKMWKILQGAEARLFGDPAPFNL